MARTSSGKRTSIRTTIYTLLRVSLEKIYADLDKIAKEHGELSEQTVARATTLLARPRYAASPNPSALLVEDLKRVIESIPNYPAPTGKPTAEWSSYNFRNYARRYFSLDEPGTTLSHRRMFGRGGEPGGTETTWMNRAVLLRVASALLELEAEVSQSATKGPADFHIEVVRAIKRFRRDIPLPERQWRFLPAHRFLFVPFEVTLEYAVRLADSTGSPARFFDLPFPTKRTRLLGVPGEQGFGWRTNDQGHKLPVVWFGGKAGAAPVRRPGELVHFAVQHRPFAVVSPREGIALSYRVEHPVSELTLQIQVAFAPPHDYEWTVWGPGLGDDDVLPVDAPLWHTTGVQPGHTYHLLGDETGSGIARAHADVLTDEADVS